MNLPNKLTVLRLFLALIIFVLLAFVQAANPTTSGEHTSMTVLLTDVAMILFVIAAITDSLDGYLARRARLVTTFGVVADPLMDKIVVVGILVYMASSDITGVVIKPWMVVLIITREFLVTGLRGFAESKGTDLFAKLLGKLKMVTQCVTLVALFLYLGHFHQESWATVFCQCLVWATVLFTIASGVGYIPSAIQLMKEDKNL